MPATQTTHVEPIETVQATSYDEPAFCQRYSDDGFILFVDCVYGVAYSSVSVGATAKYDKVSSTSTAHPTATGITGYDEPASIWNANFGSWVPNLGNLTDLSPSSSASISTPLVVTTEGGVWISGSYAGASFVGSASVLLGGGTSSSASSAAYGYKKSGKPSSLPIILSCVFGALALGFGAALFVLLHRRRRARKLGLSHSPRMSMAGGGRSAYATLPSPSGPTNSPAGPFANDRRISLLGSGAFSIFAPEEVDPLTGTTVTASGTGGLERSMTTSEKQALLREASLAERRAAAGTLEDDELAIVRQKLDSWASVARQTRRPDQQQQRLVPNPAAVEDSNSPFADTYAVVPGLQLPAGVRLPLTITTALPSPRSAPQTTAPADGGESVFSYSHTPLSLYPGVSPAEGPSSDDTRVWSPGDGTMAPLLALSPASPADSPSDPTSTAAAVGQPNISDTGRTGDEVAAARQEIDAGHLAGLRRYTLRDDGFPAAHDDDEVQPPAYRW